VGTGNPAHITKAVEALDLELSTDQWFEIRRASLGQDVP
jgi:predicted oxidoreductase